MPTQNLWRNQLLLAEIEGTSGSGETPAVGTDAVYAENIQVTPNFQIEETQGHIGSLDSEAPIVGGGGMQMSFAIPLKGSGTAGTAPEMDAILRACGLAVTNTTVAVTGEAQAGGANSITLAAGASSTDDAYTGMPIRCPGSGGDGQVVFITAYNGTTKVAPVTPAWTTPPGAGDDYEIMKNNRYAPASLDLETATLWRYQHATAAALDSHLTKVVGAAGNMSVEIGNRGLARATFNLAGILPELPSNVSHPGAPTFDTTRPPPFKAAYAYLGGAAVKFMRFSLDLGNTVVQGDDPAAAYGFDVGQVTARQISGSINPNLVALSTRNALSDFLAGTGREILLRWGSAIGNSMAILVPEARYVGATPTEVDGRAAEELPFRAVGADSGVYLVFY